MTPGDVLDQIEAYYQQPEVKASLETSGNLAVGASLGRSVEVRHIVQDSGVPLVEVFEENKRREEAGEEYTPWGCLTAAYAIEHMRWAHPDWVA